MSEKLVRRKPKELIPEDLNINLVLPAKALQALSLGGNWTGKAVVDITGPNGRMAKIGRMRDAAGSKKKYSLTPAMHQLVDLWNSRVASPPYTKIDRNRAFKKGKIATCRLDMERLTMMFSQETLKKDMDRYFETCVTGEYMFNSRDVRYRTLSGWVKALLKARKYNETCWWENQSNGNAGERVRTRTYAREEDEFPDTTELVANTYARMVLHQDDYGEPDQHWTKFEKVSLLIERIMKADIGVDRAVLVKMVIRCAEKQQREFGHKTLYPGHLTTTTLWKVALPQFLEDNLPGTSLPPME